MSDYGNFLNTKRFQRSGLLESFSLFINIFALSNCFIRRNIFQNGVHALSKNSPVRQKTENFMLFGLSDNGQILLAWLITELQMEFQASDASICNSNKKYPTGTSTFNTDFCVQALSCFYCCC